MVHSLGLHLLSAACLQQGRCGGAAGPASGACAGRSRVGRRWAHGLQGMAPGWRPVNAAAHAAAIFLNKAAARGVSCPLPCSARGSTSSEAIKRSGCS